MNKIFTTENLSWKIVSVILAFLLWMFVINTQNPTQPQEISGVQISIAGLDKLEEAGYELANRKEILEQNYKVVVNGPRLETDKLVRNPQLIVARLDLSNYLNDLNQDSISEIASYDVSINQDISGVSVKEKHAQVTKVIIEKKASKEQRISYEIDESITKQYTLIGDKKPIINPEKITISGVKTDIDRVSEAKVFIRAEDFSEDQLVSNLPIVLLDADGNRIEGLEMSEHNAEVKLPIGSEKTVPLVAKFTGHVGDGYELVNTIISPSEVTIVGKSDVLEKIREITLQPIDLSSVTKTDLIEVEMLLPEGVITLGASKVSVSLEVEEEKTLSYPIQTSELNLTVEGVGDNLSYEILTPSINVVLSALPNKLLSYLTSDIKATLDLSGYGVGEYTLPLVITPPNGARVINNPININVRVTELKDDDGQNDVTDTNNSGNVPSEGNGAEEPNEEHHQVAQSE